jgi:hypothetical protein
MLFTHTASEGGKFKKVKNYKRRTFFLILINSYFTYIFLSGSYESDVNPLIFIFAVATGLYDLKQNKEDYPDFYLFVRYFLLFLFSVGLIIDLITFAKIIL